MRNTQLLKDNLVAEGFTGQFNDSLKRFLVDRGYTGHINEALNTYLKELGYTGQLSEKLKQWEDDGLPVEFNPSVLYFDSDRGLWLDPTPPYTWEDAAGTIAATGTDPIGLIEDRSGNDVDADQPDDNTRRPLLASPHANGGGLMTFDGVNDRLLFDLTSDQRSDNMTLMMVINTTKTNWMPVGTVVNGSQNYIAAVQDGSAVTALSAGVGTPTYWADGVNINPSTRGDLHDSYATGSNVILEIRDLDLTHSDWGTMQLSGWRSIEDNLTFIIGGTVGEVFLFDEDYVSSEKRDLNRERLADRYGITL